MASSSDRFLVFEKTKAATPDTNIARVASMNEDPIIAPTPILSPLLVPSIMARIGIMVSGRAVPIAARILPTAPSPRFSLWPNHSTPLLKSSQANKITISDTANNM
jgi:hypothetical protein